MKIFSQLESAQIENVTSDPTPTAQTVGRVIYRTDTNEYKVCDSTPAWRTIFSTLDGSLTFTGLASTPGDLPAAGDFKIYVKTDGTAYLLDENGVEQPLGSGSGAGGINYVQNPNFESESDTTGHTPYKDAAQEIPEDGQGGAPTLSIVKSGVDPLDLDASGLVTKPASNVQGEGIRILMDSIALADRGKWNIFSFEYDLSDANANDGDFAVFFRDDTNGNLIRMNGEDIKAGKGTHYARVQVPIDCVDGSILLHCKATHTDTYTFKYDRVSFGPQKLANGAIVTDWKDFTPTGDFNNTTFTGRYRRVGDQLQLAVQAEVTGAVSGGTNMRIDLPFGLSIDPNKIVSTTGNDSIEGSYYATYIGHGRIIGIPVYISATSIGALILNELSSDNHVWSTSSDTFPRNDSVGDKHYFNISVPIQGWSSQTVISEDFGGRDISVYATGNANNVLTGDVTDIPFSDSVIDTTASWNGTQFTVPETGKYLITGKVAYTSGTVFTRLWIDGVADRFIGLANDNGNTRSQISAVVFLTKGQVISFRSNIAATLTDTDVVHYINIDKLDTPQTLLETETVAARYTSDSGQGLGTSTTQLIYEDKDSDTHNAYNTSTGVYTVPNSGFYDIHATLRTNVISLANNQRVDIVVYQNGSVVRSARTTGSGGNTNFFTQITLLSRYLEKGDTIDIRGVCSIATSLQTSANWNEFSIKRVK